MTRYAPEDKPESQQQKEIAILHAEIRRLTAERNNALMDLARAKADREELMSLLRKAFSTMMSTSRSVADKLEELKRGGS